MKHVRCYACNKFEHIENECGRKFWAPYQKDKTSSHSKIWKKKEVQSEKCGMAQCTEMTDSWEVQSMELQCSKSDTEF